MALDNYPFRVETMSACGKIGHVRVYADNPIIARAAFRAAVEQYPQAHIRPRSRGATALIGKILENGMRQSLHDYARAVLFDPLGLGPTEWRVGRDGERNFASVFLGINIRFSHEVASEKAPFLARSGLPRSQLESGIGG